jgi:isopentenyl-diphosphate delta-isomerase
MRMVILVDDNDEEIGTEEKIRAHQKGKLHRAFSIFVFNSKGELLLQKRAPSKYHSGGLWTNTCCSHPVPGEEMTSTIHKRLEEEMGFDCELRKAFHFIYRAELTNGMIEHEYDHVFSGIYDGEVRPNPSEVSDFKWVDLNALEKDLRNNPEMHTPWLRNAFFKILSIRTKNSADM